MTARIPIFTSILFAAAALRAANLLPDALDPAKWRHLTPPGEHGYAVFATDAAVTRAGRPSLHVKDDKGGHFNHASYRTLGGETAKRLRGQVLRASVWVKQVASSTPVGLGIGLSAARADGPDVSVSNGPGVTDATDWMNVQVKIRVPDDAVSVRVWLRCTHGFGNTGEAYFDGLVLSGEPADHPPPTLLDPARQPAHAYETTDPAEDAAAAAYRRAWREQPPQEEDGRERPVIRNGTWYWHGRPEHFVGVWLYGHDNQWGPGRNPLGVKHPGYEMPPSKELFEIMGFNSSQISSAPGHVGAAVRGFPLPEKGGGRKTGWREDGEDVKRFYARFGDVPMVLDFAFGYNGRYPPEARRLLDQRKAGRTWHAFVPFCPHVPEGWRYYRDFFLGGTRAAMRGGCNVFLYELFNESSWNDLCRYSAVDFALAMKRQFGRIEAANAAWGTVFDGFRDVAAQASYEQFPGVWYDWCVFSAARYADLLRRGAETIRRADRRKNIYFTEQADGTPPVFRGMDYRRIADVLDALAIEGGWRYGFNTRYTAANDLEAVVATGASKHFWNCDFFQALAKGRKPVVNDEHYCTRFENGTRVPSHRTDYITSLWLEVMHGVSANYTYVWDKRYWEARTPEEARKTVEKPSYKSSSLLNPFNVRPEDLCAFKDFRAELAPYQARLLPFPRVKPATVAVFFSKPTEIQRANLPKYVSFLPDEETCGSAAGDWYVTLLHAQFPVRVVFEEDLAALGPEVKALVFPGSDCNRRETAAAARAFQARGGLVVADERAFAFDERMKPVPPETGFARVADGRAAAALLAARGIPRHATLAPLDEPARPVRGADVQVCDKGDFMLVCAAAMGETAPRRVRLHLNTAADDARVWRVRNVAARTDVPCGGAAVWRAADLRRGVTLDLPPQARVVLAMEPAPVD